MNKKIFLAALLGLGMTFGFAVTINNLPRVNDHCDEYSPDFILSTIRANAVNGFKVFTYFTNSAENFPFAETYPVNGKTGQLEEFPYTPYYRYVMDFKDVTIPANSYFPVDGTKPQQPAVYHKYLSVTTIPGFTNKGCWQGFPTEKYNDDIVIESKTGEVLYGRHPDFKSRIGVIAANCPYGDNHQSKVFFGIDTENSNDATKVTTNDPQDPKPVRRKDGRLEFNYCAVNLLEGGIPRTPYDYIVLQLDKECPDGTFSFSRRHHTQSNNLDEGYFKWPNKIETSFVTLKYCFVPKDPKSKLKHPFENYHSLEIPDQYGVFALKPSDNFYLYMIHVDDEDSKNKNELNWGDETKNNTDIQNRIRKIITAYDYRDKKYENKDTDYRVIMWKGAKKALAKSVNTENTEATKTEIKSASAEIKGVDYTSIAFELKTAGNAKISIKNINGTEVARFNEQNLDAGIHIINWDSGIVMPRGRYIVTIQHNGSISAKSITLK